MDNSISHHAVVIVGGGTAGLTVAALLKAAQADLDMLPSSRPNPIIIGPTRA